MKRAVLCVPDPWNYINHLDDYSIMIINPDVAKSRLDYLLDKSDYSLLINSHGEVIRNGNDYPNERLFWYTSGTTGDSKFYSFSQQQLDGLCKSMCEDLCITANDRYVGIMGLWHAHGQSLFWATKQAGCETHFLSTKQIRQIEHFQPTFVSAIPDVLQVIGNMPLEHLRFLRSGSAPLDHALYEKLQAKFKVPVIEYFGMTEAMSHVLSNPLHGEQRMGTVGLPTNGVHASIRDGHLWIQSDQAYTKDWFDTGDLAEQDNAGYFKIVGRSSDIINVKGYKLNPVSIEGQIRKILPDLEQIVVFGKDRVKCVYVGSCDEATVFKDLHAVIGFCQPKLVKQVDEIPKNTGGKISRAWLDEIY